jgi:alkanesulfonate monooxygenase SsuD/methylene tetrahydromethanopterin reductase-like flavin-dependent oxidoreductase (luciferase family)
MRSGDRVRFGYNTPAGERGIERIDPRTFVRDLQEVCDIVSQDFDSFWVPDHFMRGDTYRLECWTQLTWLAARYPGALLGTIVMANSYRHPPLLAKMAASLQEFSHGRLVLGYGAGWLEDEYRAYGYEFPSTRVRIAQMVEGIQAIRALWTQAPASFEGAYYQVRDASCQPRPDPQPPIMIGGDGERYLLRAVAEHGDWWLPFSRDLNTLQRKISVLQQHCRDAGRDYETIQKVYPLTVYLAETAAAARERAGQALERPEPPFAGDPAALREHLGLLVDLGFRHFALAFAGFPQTDDIRLFTEEVLPAFR